MPHGALDLLRGCNIACEGCYNTSARFIKPFDQIKRELDLMMSVRRLQTVSLTGGEPTLHPELPEIIQYAKSKELRVALLTNGLLIEADYLGRLRQAGLDIVLLHIQSGQERPDLPPNPSFQQLQELRDQKARLIVEHGMEAGVSVVAYPERMEEVRQILAEILESPLLSFLLICPEGVFGSFAGIQGELKTGLKLRSCAAGGRQSSGGPEDLLAEFGDVLARAGLRPFAFLGSNVDPDDPRWISYLVAVVHDVDGRTTRASIPSAFSDWLLLRLGRWLSGRYWFFYRRGPRRFRFQILLNAITGGPFRDSFRLLMASLKPRTRLKDKHIVVEHAPRFDGAGKLTHCRNCPDAVIRDGQLVPACLADRMAPP
jgi:hypothetical protein